MEEAVKQRSRHSKWGVIHGIPETIHHEYRARSEVSLGSRVRASRKSTRAAFYSAFALLLDSQSKVVIITLLLDVTEKEKYSPEASSPVTDGFQCIEMNRYSGLLHWLWELIQCFCS